MTCQHTYEQTCSYFDSKGGCKNRSELLDNKYPLDFCAMHNHMQKTGIPTKCWRCGYRELKR